MTHIISYKEFKSVDIRVGTIISAEENLKLNNPSIILKIDFGKKIGIKKSSAQLIKNYKSEDLINKQILKIKKYITNNYSGLDILVNNAAYTKYVQHENLNELSEDLINKQIAAVVNFESKQIGNLLSEVLVLGFPDNSNEPILIEPNKIIPNGGKLF